MRIPELPAGIRPATPDDVPVIGRLIRELAEYEKEPEAAQASEDDLHRHLFGEDAVARGLVAELDGEVVGIAVWYRTFSTWTGVPGIHLEDLFVQDAARGYRFGLRLISALARIVEANGWQRLEWAVLDWNTPSIAFYDRLGGQHQADWLTYRLADDALTRVAALD
ncbi:MAG: GNAT family N-acetyltransferase [Aeromicrobium erythreum]